MVLSTPSFSQILKGYLIIVTKGDYFINSVCVCVDDVTKLLAAMLEY